MEELEDIFISFGEELNETSDKFTYESNQFSKSIFSFVPGKRVVVRFPQGVRCCSYYCSTQIKAARAKRGEAVGVSEEGNEGGKEQEDSKEESRKVILDNCSCIFDTTP